MISKKCKGRQILSQILSECHYLKYTEPVENPSVNANQAGRTTKTHGSVTSISNEWILLRHSFGDLLGLQIVVAFQSRE